MTDVKGAKLVRLTTNNQVAIPTVIVRHLRLNRGTFLEVKENGRQIVMTPKRVVDEDDFRMYQEVIKRGRAQFRRGETVTWENVKKKLSRAKK